MKTRRIVFDEKATNHLKAKMFFDEGGMPALARYEQVKYETFENFTDKQQGFFWRPTEVDLSKDNRDFKLLPPNEQHIFTSNLFRQILLDSVQGRGPNLTFLPVCSLPEVENWIENWGMNETIHSRSYTHVIRNIYPDPSKTIDDILTVPEILECAVDITKYYDQMIVWNARRVLHQNGLKAWHASDGMYEYDEEEHKRVFWLCLNSVNILEGIRFYVSFACSWNFAEQKKLEGNAKIIRFICRDENLHLAATQFMLRKLPKDDSIYESIQKQENDRVIGLFYSAIEQEKDWARYLFTKGSMIGLNEDILRQYVDWIGSRRMMSINLPVDFEYPKSDPLPWTKNWISGKEVQVAPQEAEISSYIVSGLNQDVDESVLGSLDL